MEGDGKAQSGERQSSVGFVWLRVGHDQEWGVRQGTMEGDGKVLERE